MIETMLEKELKQLDIVQERIASLTECIIDATENNDLSMAREAKRQLLKEIKDRENVKKQIVALNNIIDKRGV